MKSTAGIFIEGVCSLPVDALIVLEHGVVRDSGAEHGVPGPLLQQQLLPPNVNHSRNVLVPACHIMLYAFLTLTLLRHTMLAKWLSRSQNISKHC